MAEPVCVPVAFANTLLRTLTTGPVENDSKHVFVHVTDAGAMRTLLKSTLCVAPVPVPPSWTRMPTTRREAVTVLEEFRL